MVSAGARFFSPTAVSCSLQPALSIGNLQPGHGR
jgi:hypothetical protein